MVQLRNGGLQTSVAKDILTSQTQEIGRREQAIVRVMMVADERTLTNVDGRNNKSLLVLVEEIRKTGTMYGGCMHEKTHEMDDCSATFDGHGKQILKGNQKKLPCLRTTPHLLNTRWGLYLNKEKLFTVLFSFSNGVSLECKARETRRSIAANFSQRFFSNFCGGFLSESFIDLVKMGMAAEPQFHILAVDDSLIDRKLIERLLKTSSDQVTTVDSGSKALEFLGFQDDELSITNHPCVSPDIQQEVEVNLIITDYCMPGMTGYDLLKKIKESSALRHIPVVIMSSENVPSRISRCLEEGAEEFFLKPVQLSDSVDYPIRCVYEVGHPCFCDGGCRLKISSKMIFPCQVHYLIERCIQQCMDQHDTMAKIYEAAKIHPRVTELAWMELEQQNPKFFEAYRHWLALKDDIILFNELLEKQVEMMKQIRSSDSSSSPPEDKSKRTSDNENLGRD
ncbi:hypothetical protein Ancab_013892 [Ancistrocladus abbreviatus]